MDFLTALSTGASVDYVTTEYMCSFMQAVAANPSNWLGRVSYGFVGQCFRVLGLKFNISVEAFQQTYNHPYREDNLNYIFNVVPFVLKNVDAFLDQLPTSLAACERLASQDRPSSCLGSEFYDLVNPVLCYLRVVRVWTMVVLGITDKLQLKDKEIDRFLCEPLARMSFSLLRGLAKLLPDYGQKFELLKDNCLSLAVLARYGIFYEETCQFILTPMLDMFEEHFQLFCGETKSALNFIYWIFRCEMSNKDSYIQTYQFLEMMLDRFEVGQQRDASGNLYLRLFTNELITEKYLGIQFEMLKVKNSNPLLRATLQYLQTLQRHLVSTEIFPRRFLEQILLILLDVSNASNSVCSLAAELYVTLSQRQYQEQELFVHIMETFIKTQSSVRKWRSYEQFMSVLQSYLKKLIDHFPAMQHFKFYINVINAVDVREELILFTAHAACALFELYTVHYAELEIARQQVHKLLRQWPNLVQSSAERPKIRSVIYGIYSAVDFEAVAQHKPNLICALERHCLNIFLDDETLSESEYSILFPNICRSIEATGNEHLLVTAALALQDRYAEISVNFMGHEQAEIQPEMLQDYGQCVRCLYALLKQNKLRGHQVCDMYQTLAMQMLHIVVANEHLGLYGYECLALMLVLLHREREELEDMREHETRSMQLAEMLRDVCVRKLCNILDNLALAKSLFCAIVVLQVGLQHSLSLNALTYDTLLTQLSDSTLAMKAREKPLTLGYVQEMHLCFRQLHECELIVLPTNRIWKPLLQYKLLTITPDYISPELEQLIVVLIKRHIVTYARNLSVIQLHVCNERPNKQRVTAAVAAHMRLVDAHASPKDAWLLKLHVFNASLQLLVNRLSVRRTEPAATKPRNHLLPLRHLQSLVNTLRLEEPHFIIIARLLSSLKGNAFADVDTQEVDKFIKQISAYKYRCEDEHAKAVADVR
ncbi:uncharacterized protein sunn [Drosophila montana]|uniref:uncharacterized protein sunn n=1 Tax=Drosophila montana TaxID=40370 RepID=UPI00313AD765